MDIVQSLARSLILKASAQVYLNFQLNIWLTLIAYKGNIFHRSYHFIDFISNIIICVFLNWRLLACKGIFADRIIVIYFNFEV